MSEISNGVQGFSVESQVLHANNYKRIIARIGEYHWKLDASQGTYADEKRSTLSPHAL